MGYAHGMDCCMQMPPKVGKPAPHFEGEAYVSGETRKISLSDYKGKWVVLFFYPLDFTFVCPTELRGLGKAEEEFKKLNAQPIGASVDSVHSHKAWFSKDLPEVKFPILSDMSHEISEKYGVLIGDKGFAHRGTFIIDPEGVLQYVTISSLDVGRSVDEILRVLSALQTGGLCPMDWKPGQKTIEK